MTARLIVVAVLVALMIVGRWLYRRWQAGVVTAAPRHPPVPADLLGAERTWVVFTTPYCASCGPAKEQIAAADPQAHIVTIDATTAPDLADAFHVRSVPTVLLADESGIVQQRLVGAAAVRDYVSTAAVE